MVAVEAECVMQKDMGEEEQGQAELALTLVQAVQALNDAAAAAAKFGVYAKLSIYRYPATVGGLGKPRETYAISIESSGQAPTR
jgi:hypothetical protein